MKDKSKFIKGKWYKDKEGDFIKFNGFDRIGDFKYTARVSRYGVKYYVEMKHIRSRGYFSICNPMTIEEMKQNLPESEWWSEQSSELFPIF